MLRTVWLLLLFGLTLSGQGPSRRPVLALTHAGVIDVEGGQLLEDRTVVIRDDRIFLIGDSRSTPVPTGAETRDCRGQFLIPGLWDMHAHGTYVPWTLALSAVNGVLGLREMGIGLEEMRTLKRTANGFWSLANVPIPVRIGAVAGPLLDGYDQWPGISMLVRTPEEGRHAVDVVKAAGADFVKIHTQISRATWWAIVNRAHEVGIPFAGHVPYAISLSEAIDQHQQTIEHLEGVPTACSSDEENLRQEAVSHLGTREGSAAAVVYRLAGRLAKTFDSAKCRAIVRKMAQNQIWNVPTLAGLDPRNAGSPGPADPRFRYIPNILMDLWSRPPDHIDDSYRRLFDEYLEITRMLQEEGVGIMTGTDTPVPGVFPGLMVHEDLALLVRAGLTNAAALRSATLNPARFLHKEDEIGRVAPGKLADLVLLDANPLQDIHNTTKIRAVISEGRFFDRSSLDRILQGLARPPQVKSSDSH